MQMNKQIKFVNNVNQVVQFAQMIRIALKNVNQDAPFVKMIRIAMSKILKNLILI